MRRGGSYSDALSGSVVFPRPHGDGVAWLAAEGIRITKLVRGGSNRDDVLIRIFRLSRLRKLHLLVVIAVLALMVWQPS